MKTVKTDNFGFKENVNTVSTHNLVLPQEDDFEKMKREAINKIWGSKGKPKRQATAKQSKIKRNAKKTDAGKNKEDPEEDKLFYAE